MKVHIDTFYSDIVHRVAGSNGRGIRVSATGIAALELGERTLRAYDYVPGNVRDAKGTRIVVASIGPERIYTRGDEK